MTNATHTMDYLHIFADTAEGRMPFTYLIFGPYAHGEYDVEIHEGHVTETEMDTYVTTVSDLPRNTHICADMWDTMSRVASGEIQAERWDA